MIRWWLQNDKVYQAIMSGALFIVFVAALMTSHWPQLSVVAGSITAIMVSIVAVVYWVAVVRDNHDRPNSTDHRQDAPAKRKNRRASLNQKASLDAHLWRPMNKSSLDIWRPCVGIYLKPRLMKT